MSNRPVLEEVDDDDIDVDMDIAQFDPGLRTPIAPAARAAPPVARAADATIVDPNGFSEAERAELRSFQLIYPCYFDKNRSHVQGRRVSAAKAVRNPLAKTISDACRHLFVQCMLELDKTHPQDYGNPGRVRVLLKADGAPHDERFKTKRQLLNVIADYLILHPTTLELVGPASGIPLPREYEQGYEPVELPRVKGFQMNTIVPVHLQLSIKHPMTKSIYDAPPPPPPGVKAPPKQKKKVMRMRG